MRVHSTASCLSLVNMLYKSLLPPFLLTVAAHTRTSSCHERILTEGGPNMMTEYMVNESGGISAMYNMFKFKAQL